MIFQHLRAPFISFLVIMSMASMYEMGYTIFDEYDIMVRCIAGIHICFKADRALYKNLKARKQSRPIRPTNRIAKKHEYIAEQLEVA